MSNTEKRGKHSPPTPEKVKAFERIERLSRLTQNIHEWVLHYHHKDEAFCEVFEMLADCTGLVFTQIESQIIPFTDDDLIDPTAREKRINSL